MPGIPVAGVEELLDNDAETVRPVPRLWSIFGLGASSSIWRKATRLQRLTTSLLSKANLSAVYSTRPAERAKLAVHGGVCSVSDGSLDQVCLPLLACAPALSADG